jgi:hypothetical protein
VSDTPKIVEYWVPIAEMQKRERELAEVTKQRDNLIKELEYIAHSGLSAMHLVDHAIASIKAMEGGAQ